MRHVRTLLIALMLLAPLAARISAQEEFGRPIGEGDAPVGGPSMGGAAVGEEDDDEVIGGPAVGGAAAGEGDAPIGGPMVGGAPAGEGDAPIGGPAVGGEAVGQDDDDEAIGGAPVY